MLAYQLEELSDTTYMLASQGRWPQLYARSLFTLLLLVVIRQWNLIYTEVFLYTSRPKNHRPIYIFTLTTKHMNCIHCNKCRKGINRIEYLYNTRDVFDCFRLRPVKTFTTKYVRSREINSQFVKTVRGQTQRIFIIETCICADINSFLSV